MQALASRRASEVNRYRAIGQLNDTIAAFRELKAEMPMQMASVFLAIAMRPGIHQKDLPEVMGLSQSSISRNVTALTSRGNGLGLVYKQLDPIRCKTHELHLTPSGRALIDSLTEKFILVQ